MWQSGKVALWHFAYFATLPHCHIKVVDNPLSKKKRVIRKPPVLFLIVPNGRIHASVSLVGIAIVNIVEFVSIRLTILFRLFYHSIILPYNF
jgi:hypothetical protein